jgi:tRNA threonylcarbamoyladenosine biosynthesis protein TsaB
LALILNIETSTTVCSVSLSEGEKLVSFKELNSGYTHSENLTLFIQDILKENNLIINDIEAVAISKGPGSYTGLRIGVSSAKGLCYALNIPLIAVDTLQYFAHSISSLNEYKNSSNVLFCPMIDARRMEVYCAIYDKNNIEIKATEAKIINNESFSDLLKTNKIVFFGNGSEKCKEVFANNENALFLDNEDLSSKYMSSFSNIAFENKDFEDVLYFEPFYLKDFLINKSN